ncbi:MAG: tetratricopeptide repeat protein [Chloroflexia bacterium]|nr:tetratricopeptide repeat protein [Chloroflexia bacterium]
MLDNFEHLIAGAASVADLLASCPALTVLVTSRELLHIRAERHYDLAPLALPDLGSLAAADELNGVPAVQLFVDRAETANRTFALTAENARSVAEIVVRLDGLPLAIELAAARVKVLPPAALLARLQRRLPLLSGGAVDLPVRQRAMRSAIDWSNSLLDDDDRVLFRRLAVFDGGFTLDAAEVTAACSIDLLDGLSSLVDKSLLRVIDDPDAGPRFQMLETIRELGLDHLAANQEADDARAHHAAWCVALVEQADPMLTGPEQARWFSRLEQDHGNIRSALRWVVARRDAESAMRLGGALYRFWATNGNFDEGTRWLDQILDLQPDAQSAARGHCLLGSGVMAYFRGQYERAESDWEQAKSLFDSLGDVRGVAYSFGNLCLVADAAGDYERATASYEEALALFRTLLDQTYIGFMLHNLGLIAHFQGDQERASRLGVEALALARGRGDRNSTVMTLGNLGLVAFAREDYRRAAAFQTEALELGQAAANKPWLAKTVEQFALIAAVTGKPARAARLFAAAAAFRAKIGAAVPPNDDAVNRGYIAAVHDRLGDEPFAAAWREGDATSLAEAIRVALDPNDL